MNKSKEHANELSHLLQLVSFNLDKEEFGVDILNVQEINRMMMITKVPNSPDYIEGVINLRGRVIPVIDLRTKLGMQKKDSDKNTRIIVTETNNKIVGFIVDSVKEVIRIPEEITEEPPKLTTGINSDYIKAVGKLEDRLLILIDLNKILSATELKELNKAA